MRVCSVLMQVNEIKRHAVLSLSKLWEYKLMGVSKSVLDHWRNSAGFRPGGVGVRVCFPGENAYKNSC